MPCRWDYRTIIVLHDVEGLSLLEVSAALSLSLSNVNSRVHRARLFLRKRLSEAVTTRADLLFSPQATGSLQGDAGGDVKVLARRRAHNALRGG
jgi:Sigma-70, region 4